MSQNLSVWLLILLAFVCANLPFVNQRLMTVVPLRAPVKNLAWRVAEGEWPDEAAHQAGRDELNRFIDMHALLLDDP